MHKKPKPRVSQPALLILPILLAAAITLDGCRQLPIPEPSTPEPSEATGDYSEPVASPPIATPVGTGRFTLRYDSKTTLNPITALNRDNILLSSLMYESLFILDGALEPEQVLCSEWATEDNIVYYLEILPGVPMTNGTFLTADDVAYTLKQAMQRGRYVNRLSGVSSVSAENELSVKITLRAPNSRFTRLLDIPIIKNGSIDNRVPPGTGPYFLVESDETATLEPFTGHRDYALLPFDVVHLIECMDDELTQLFDDGEISLLLDDPSDAFDITLNRLPEKRYFETTTIQFIGFNAREGVMRSPDVRRAIGCSIDRDYIVSEIFSGQAVAAPLPISPCFSLYDKDWEKRDLDPLSEMTLLLRRAYMDDYNEDSYLEISDGYQTYSSFSLDFIVNSENTTRVRAANEISDTLRQYGFRINLRELPWDAFLNALKSGDFDMYYGEITLGADFDLSPLLIPGALNYGGTSTTAYKQFTDPFLSAATDYDTREAAVELIKEITEQAPFVPILYKRYVVYSPMGAISGAHPGQSNVFRNLSEWTINFRMLS